MSPQPNNLIINVPIKKVMEKTKMAEYTLRKYLKIMRDNEDIISYSILEEVLTIEINKDNYFINKVLGDIGYEQE